MIIRSISQKVKRSKSQKVKKVNGGKSEFVYGNESIFNLILFDSILSGITDGGGPGVGDVLTFIDKHVAMEGTGHAAMTGHDMN